MIRIVLADDHHIIRKELRALLSYETDFEVVGEASTGSAAIEIAEQLKPDILVLDIMMPEMNGLQVAARLAVSCPYTRIVILSMHNSKAYVHAALHSGAKAYILKDNTADELISAIRQVHSGKCYLNSSLPEEISQVPGRDEERKDRDT